MKLDERALLEAIRMAFAKASPFARMLDVAGCEIDRAVARALERKLLERRKSAAFYGQQGSYFGIPS
jgi:hypothetical protein